MSILSIFALVSSVGVALAHPFSLSPRGVASFPAGSSWDILLSNGGDMSSVESVVNDNFQVIDIDLFDTDTATISELKKNKRVICYFSAGTSEGWRQDANKFTKQDQGGAVGGGPDGDWPDELWLDVTSENVKSIMKSRIEMAAKAGCDAVDPDNVDGFDNETGFSHPKSAYVAYVKYMAEIAKKNNLAIGLKNAVDMIPDVVNDVQFAINEQCHEYSGECAKYKPFTDQKKAVFNIEYGGNACNSPAGVQLSTVIKSEDQGLNELGGACGGQEAETPSKVEPVHTPSSTPTQPIPTPSNAVGDSKEGEEKGDEEKGDEEKGDEENGDEEVKEDSGQGPDESPNDNLDENDEDHDNNDENEEESTTRPGRYPIKRPHRWGKWHKNGRWN